MIKDSAPEKWIYKEHTRVKHILLEKYLDAWIPILGRWNPKICYFDGFAGRGDYRDEKTGKIISIGSPIIALKVADRQANYFDKILFVLIEKDEDNFKNLKEVLEREKVNINNLKKIEIIMENFEFSDSCEEIFDNLEQKECILIPSFFFIDPFGFSGIPFRIIKKILTNPKTEVFFNFMARDIGRFLELPQVENIFMELFNTDEWRNLLELPNRDQALTELYRKQLHQDAEVKYSLQFRVSESERLKTLYYLVHATNNLKGHNIMKGIMFNQSVHGSFAYLGPNDLSERSQIRLFNVNDTDELKVYLVERFKGETLTFDEILEKICIPWYDEPPYIERHHREALKTLKKEEKIKVTPVTSKTERGLSGDDIISFDNNNPLELRPSISTQKKRNHIKF